MRYLLFFELEIGHQYINDNDREWIIVPNEPTLAVLNGPHFFVKPTAKGLAVFKRVADGSSPNSSSADNEIFGFTIFPISDRFCEFTDEQLSEGHIRLFTNKNLKKGNFDLMRSEASNSAKFKGFSAVARVEIIAKDVKPGTGDKVPVYQAIFQTKAVKWKYYFVMKTSTTNLKVEDRNQKISFEKTAEQEDSSDKIATSLKIRYPKTQIAIFESTTAIAGTNTGIKNIQLLLNGNLIIKHLPNPDPAHNGIEIIQLR